MSGSQRNLGGRTSEEAKQRAAPEPPARSGTRSDGNAGVVAGLPRFLEGIPEPAALAVHHSPPTVGPGSRAEAIVHDRRSVQPLAAMRPDTYYRSPVNPHNPVLVWTDGTTIFFAPSAGELGAGRSAALPEPSFAPPGGYIAEELHWDRVSNLTTGGGPLVIIARKPGEPDLEVAISNTLEQKAHFIALGVTGGASAIVSRENKLSSMPGWPCVTPSHIAGTPPATCAVAPCLCASSRITSGKCS